MINTILNYKRIEDLENFVKTNHFTDTDKIYIQLQIPLNTDNTLISEVIDQLMKYYPGCHITGYNTYGSFRNEKTISHNKITIIFSIFEKTKIETINLQYHKNASEKEINELIQQSVQTITHSNTQGFKITSCDLLRSGQNVIDAIQSVAGKEVEIFGCVTAVQEGKQPQIRLENTIIYDGIIISSFSSDTLTIKHYSSNGWYTVGKQFDLEVVGEHYITKIDGKPARSFIEEHVGDALENSLYDYGWIYPLIHKDTHGLFHIYPYYAKKNDKGIYSLAKISKETRVQFSYANNANISYETKCLFDKLVNTKSEGIMVFSCYNRKMQNENGDELISGKYAGNVPIYGAYNLINYTKTNTINYLNFGMVDIVSMSENTGKIFHLIEENNPEQYKAKKRKKLGTHLIEYCSKEMGDYNNYLMKDNQEKSKLVDELYFKDFKTGLFNERKLTNDLKNGMINKLAYIGLPILTKYITYYGSETTKDLITGFCNYSKLFCDNYGGYLYQINTNTFAMGFGESLSHSNFLTLLVDFQSLLESKKFFVQEKQIYLNCCLGIASNQENLIEKASIALASAINNGEAYVSYNTLANSLSEDVKAIEMVETIKHAIKHDYIFPVFQPIYNNKEKRITKYEALVRLTDKEGNMIFPGAFLEISKKANLYASITQIMIQKTLETFQNQDLEVSLNISILDIQNKDTLQFIFETLKKYPHPERIVFELLESEKIDQFEEVNTFIKKVKELGVKIALDDFGSGYCNLIYFARLKSDYIKIDGSIVKDFAIDSIAAETLKTIKGFGQVTNQEIIAEFVSNKDIQNKALELGVDYSQGYFIGKPQVDLLPEDYTIS